MPAKRLPNMLIIGAKKASSTLLYELLCQHPQVWMPQEKEPHCLVTASDPDKIREQYARLFEPAPDSALILGEASTGYTTMPYNGPIPRRIQQALGQPKLIYILRDPVERLISNYRHSYLRGWYKPNTTLGEALADDPILIDTSCYAYQIQSYARVFGDQAMHILLAENLHANPVGQMQRVERYLELSPWDGWPDQPPTVNSFNQLAVSDRYRWLNRFKGVKRFVRAVVPTRLKEKIQKRSSKPVATPPITSEDREQVYQSIRRDLRWLRHMLGDVIDTWPSTQRLLREEPEFLGHVNTPATARHTPARPEAAPSMHKTQT